jgi:hypothetical protein
MGKILGDRRPQLGVTLYKISLILKRSKQNAFEFYNYSYKCHLNNKFSICRVPTFLAVCAAILKSAIMSHFYSARLPYLYFLIPPIFIYLKWLLAVALRKRFLYGHILYQSELHAQSNLIIANAIMTFISEVVPRCQYLAFFFSF